MVGSGALAEGLSLALQASGVVFDELIVRRKHARARALASSLGAQLTTISQSSFAAPVVWLAVSDAAIASLAEQLAARGAWRGKVVLHSSGALSSSELTPLQKAGAAVASAHPMMSFVRGSQPKLSGACLSIEGDRKAVRFAELCARLLACDVLKLKAANKAAYHAYGAMLSPMLLTELTAALGVAKQAGLSEAQAKEILRPIVMKTIENLLTLGPEAALSGPLARGDVATTELHLSALKGPERELYMALARYASARLPVKNIAELLKLIE